MLMTKKKEEVSMLMNKKQDKRWEERSDPPPPSSSSPSSRKQPLPLTRVHLRLLSSSSLSPLLLSLLSLSLSLPFFVVEISEMVVIKNVILNFNRCVTLPLLNRYCSLCDAFRRMMHSLATPSQENSNHHSNSQEIFSLERKKNQETDRLTQLPGRDREKKNYAATRRVTSAKIVLKPVGKCQRNGEQECCCFSSWDLGW